jgi:cyanophycin synthetase
MGQPGDLLLVFADALIRSWKQITKFKSATSPASVGEVARSAGEGASAGERLSARLETFPLKRQPNLIN